MTVMRRTKAQGLSPFQARSAHEIAIRLADFTTQIPRFEQSSSAALQDVGAESRT